jgi:prophage regulatory protein
VGLLRQVRRLGIIRSLWPFGVSAHRPIGGSEPEVHLVWPGRFHGNMGFCSALLCLCESQTGDRQMAPLLIPYEALKAKCIMYSKPHLWRLEKAGKFPKRVSVGTSRYGYVEDEIDAYIADRIAARDAAKAA